MTGRLPSGLAIAIAVATALFATASLAGAEQATLRAVPRRAVIHIDGRLNEGDWQSAPPAAGFTQRDPNDGEPASFPTEFRVIYDRKSIYVAVRAFDPEPERIRGVLSRRDVTSASDWLLVGFDSYLDRRTSFAFAINPAGVERDWMIYDDGETEDPSWNAVWEGAAAIDELGWTAELRIPLSQLRYSEERSVWGMQVARVIQRLGEESFWSAFPKTGAGVVSHFGELTGLDALSASGGIEVIPYGLLGVERGLGGGDDTELRWRMGVDLRHRLSTNLVLSATLNPDFGQVEADPSDVNLSAFETFFPEQRPFFLEGRDLFSMRLGGNGLEELFYSRRIGAAPHYEPDEYEELPRETRIYGAAKISGKSAAGWSVAALSALTPQETAKVIGADGAAADEVVEPLTSYNVLSLRRDFRGGRTNVATLLTGVSRDLERTGLDWLHDQALAGGAQVTSKHFDDEYLLRARVLGSRVHGSTEALLETQRDSPHYYQRSDAHHLVVDETRTTLSGWNGFLEVSRNAGERWRGGVGSELRSPGFEVNDLGFQYGADYAVPWAWIELRDDQPGEWLNNWKLSSSVWAVYDFDALHIVSGGDFSGAIRHTSYWMASWNLGAERIHWDPKRLRGGPAVRMTDRAWVVSDVQSDPRAPIRGTLSVRASASADGTERGLDLSLPLTFAMWHKVELVVQPAVAVRRDELQYVDAPTDQAGSTRYLLARIDQTTARLTLRANYTFTPHLSLQLYAQPYFSAGRYRDYKEPHHADARLLDERYRTFPSGRVSRAGDTVVFDAGSAAPFSVERPDFSFRQLRSTVVLRWQPAAGAAIFVVWSHDRTNEGDNGLFRLRRDISTLADEPGEHVVLLKVSWWLEGEEPNADSGAVTPAPRAAPPPRPGSAPDP